MSASARGMQFEREIREQPAVWESLAGGDAAERLARTLSGRVVLVDSGSSLFVAPLGALALRRRRIEAVAVAATQARLDHNAYEDATVIAISQSGRSSDLFEALNVLRPRLLVALTNSPDSELAARFDVVLDVAAGEERAIPAGRSQTKRPQAQRSFDTLGWLVTAQLLALCAARARGIDCDAPRGLREALAGTE